MEELLVYNYLYGYDIDTYSYNMFTNRANHELYHFILKRCLSRKGKQKTAIWNVAYDMPISQI